MMHLLITDSGLGGLSVCAEVERALRETGRPKSGVRRPMSDSGHRGSISSPRTPQGGSRAGAPATLEPVEARTRDDDVQSLRITYFNAWPEAGRGYNDLPDITSRARVFDRALASMAATGPDRIVIACNTLSIIYNHTAFSRTTAIPVLGIVDAGVDLFYEALTADPASSIVMFGTRTTIESGVHREGLIERGIAARRIAAVSCHGLAKAIETDADGDVIADFIEKCTARACQADPHSNPLYLGVCCTHYTYVKEEMRAALERRCGRRVDTLDPDGRLVAELLRQTGHGPRENRASLAPPVTGITEAGADAESRPACPERSRRARPGRSRRACPERSRREGRALRPHGMLIPGSGPGRTASHTQAPVAVTVVSKVEMDDNRRRSMARRVEAVSPATAAALLSYTRVADLF